MSSEFKYSDGQVVYPLGDDAIGILIYDGSGYMSLQLMRRDRPAFSTGNPNGGTIEEIKSAFGGFVAYFGNYEVNQEQGIVTHHLEGSLIPNWVGKGLKRFFQLSSNHLTLITPPVLIGNRHMTTKLAWERIS